MSSENTKTLFELINNFKMPSSSKLAWLQKMLESTKFMKSLDLDYQDEATGKTLLMTLADIKFQGMQESDVEHGRGTSMYKVSLRRTFDLLAIRLIELGANVNLINDLDSGNTAVTYAAKRHRTDLIEILSSAGADLDVATQNKNTPLHWIAKTRRWDAELAGKTLFESGADINARNAQGHTPKDVAEAEGVYPEYRGYLNPEAITMDADIERRIGYLLSRHGKELLKFLFMKHAKDEKGNYLVENFITSTSYGMVYQFLFTIRDKVDHIALERILNSYALIEKHLFPLTKDNSIKKTIRNAFNLSNSNVGIEASSTEEAIEEHRRDSFDEDLDMDMERRDIDMTEEGDFKDEGFSTRSSGLATSTNGRGSAKESPEKRKRDFFDDIVAEHVAKSTRLAGRQVDSDFDEESDMERGDVDFYAAASITHPTLAPSSSMDGIAGNWAFDAHMTEEEGSKEEDSIRELVLASPVSSSANLMGLHVTRAELGRKPSATIHGVERFIEESKEGATPKRR